MQLHFPRDHPVGAGHFPGTPMIPGALLLDAVIAAIAGTDENTLMIRGTKFLHPVRPGENVNLSWREQGSSIKFECRLAASQALAMTGTLELGRSAA